MSDGTGVGPLHRDVFALPFFSPCYLLSLALMFFSRRERQCQDLRRIIVAIVQRPLTDVKESAGFRFIP